MKKRYTLLVLTIFATQMHVYGASAALRRSGTFDLGGKEHVTNQNHGLWNSLVAYVNSLLAKQQSSDTNDNADQTDAITQKEFFTGSSDDDRDDLLVGFYDKDFPASDDDENVLTDNDDTSSDDSDDDTSDDDSDDDTSDYDSDDNDSQFEGFFPTIG